MATVSTAVWQLAAAVRWFASVRQVAPAALVGFLWAGCGDAPEGPIDDYCTAYCADFNRCKIVFQWAVASIDVGECSKRCVKHEKAEGERAPDAYRSLATCISASNCVEVDDAHFFECMDEQAASAPAVARISEVCARLVDATWSCQQAWMSDLAGWWEPIECVEYFRGDEELEEGIVQCVQDVQSFEDAACVGLEQCLLNVPGVE